MYLNTHSYYSLRYGTFCPKTLLNLALENGLRSIALTDINTTSGCLEFIREAKKLQMKPVVGVDFRNGVQQRFVMLARNNNGFEQINVYLSEILHNELEVPIDAPALDDTYVIYPFDRNNPTPKLKSMSTSV